MNNNETCPRCDNPGMYPNGDTDMPLICTTDTDVCEVTDYWHGDVVNEL